MPLAVAFIAGLIGVGGTALGAWLTQHGARRTAELTLAGQREMARDDAARKRRDALVQPFLDLARKRPGQYLAWLEAVQDAGAALEPLVHLRELWLDMGYQTIPSARFRGAAEAYLKADLQVDALLHGDEHGHVNEPYVQASIRTLVQCVVALQQAADAYVLGYDEDEPVFEREPKLLP